MQSQSKVIDARDRFAERRLQAAAVNAEDAFAALLNTAQDIRRAGLPEYTRIAIEYVAAAELVLELRAWLPGASDPRRAA